MRPLEQLAMHLRGTGKGKGRTYEIPLGAGRYVGPRLAICRVDGLREPFGLVVAMKERKHGKLLRYPRKPTLEELETIRHLFFAEDETVVLQINPPNRETTVTLFQE